MSPLTGAFIHYQDFPSFIGPRLPKEHPAYQAFIRDSAAEIIPGLHFDMGGTAIGPSDLDAAEQRYGANTYVVIANVTIRLARSAADQGSKS
ncbi:MAG: hypothetical protein ABL893_04775 [Hyphomicrobium sp.]